MNAGFDWAALSPALDALLALDAEARARELARIADSDAARAAALRDWLAAIERSEGRFGGALAVPPAGLGPWRVLERIGQGGMGEVWRGERADGAFQRQVAIKLLRVDRAEVAASIARERELLARLAHPGIAALLDGGVAQDGRPWLVTEWVAGQRLDVWLTHGAPALRSRVALLREVALAVAHAHSQLVIHRDLKPANVMVDDLGRARLLDFGIARLLAPGHDATLTADAALTPAFAAPEQLRGDPVGTRTDVHALGGLLYFLLTGHTPHGEADSSLAAVVQRICNEDPVAPSRVAPAAGVDADLDAIALTALARDPSARYASADAFAADLDRWLAGADVSARLPSRLERAARFVRRHRLPVALAAGLLLALLGGLIGALWLQHEAAQARLIAESERNMALQELARSQSLRDGTLAVFRDAGEAERGSANEWLDRIAAEAARSDGALREPAARARLLAELAILENERGQPARAALLYERLLAGPVNELPLDAQARAHCGQARVLHLMGDLDAALVAFRRGQALAETLDGSARTALVYCLTFGLGTDGNAPSAEAIPSLQRALRELDALTSLQESRYLRATTLHALGMAHDLAGNAEQAITHYRQALDIDRALGQSESLASATTLGAIAGLQMMLGQPREADRSYAEATALAERVGGRSLSLAIDLANHASLKNTLGEFAEAARLARAALAMLDAVAPGVLTTRGNAALELGKALERLNEPEAALEALAEAERAFITAHGPDHDHAGFPAMSRARVLIGQGRLEEAAAVLDTLEQRYRARGSFGALAAVRSLQALRARTAGDVAAARSAAAEALQLQRERGPADHWRVAAAALELAVIEAALGDHARAQALRSEALPIARAALGATHWRVREAEAAATP